MKTIYYYGVGSNHNFETSVYGGKLIKIPLFEALVKLGFKIRWLGWDCDDYKKNNYLDLLGLRAEDFKLDASHLVEHTSFFVEGTVLGPLLVELRPNIKKEGYNFEKEWAIQIHLINTFIKQGLPVFIWDQDCWADQIPKEYRDKIILLRPYFNKADSSFVNQEEFFYMWYVPWFDKKLERLAENKIFDVMYCGNVYNRRDEFLEFLKPFDEANKKVCVQGNWLRKKYDDRDFSLDNFQNFMFFGQTPHWSTLPSIAMSKSVIHFANKEQQQAGLFTARIFEALMGKSVLFCTNKISGIETIMPKELIVENGEELYEKWEFIDKHNLWVEMRNLFVSRLQTLDMSNTYRAEQFAQYIRKYT